MKDLYEICEAIKGHLPEESRDNLEVIHYGEGEFGSCDYIEYNGCGVVRMAMDGTYDNYWKSWIRCYDISHITLYDIFEEIGTELTEVKVKKIDEGEL